MTLSICIYALSMHAVVLPQPLHESEGDHHNHIYCPAYRSDVPGYVNPDKLMGVQVDLSAGDDDISADL